MTRKRPFIPAVTLLSAFAVACADHEPTAPAPVGGFMTAITCQAAVSTGTFSCDGATPLAGRGIELDVILGGQHTYVTLTSSATAYNSGTQAFTTNVTVQNLTAQPMATTDGTTPDAGGIKVFVHSGPTATSGFGTITVANPDGSGTFTGSNQPYWQYSGVLAPQAISSSKLWRFNVPNTVGTFAFQVFVTTKLPADASVLRWLAVTSPATQTLRGVKTNHHDPTRGWAVGDNGTILHYDGTSWSAVTTGFALSAINLYGVDAHGDGAVYIVGDGGTIVHSPDDGVHWSLQSSPVTTALFSVGRVSGGGGGPSPVFAVGAGGVILHSADGTTWNQQSSGTTDSLFVTGGPADNDWFAGGQGGTLLHWNGTAWSARSSGTTASLHGAAGNGDQSGLTDLWVVGTGGTIIHSPDGVTWSPQASGTTQDLFGVNNFPGSSTDVFAVGSAGTIVHWNGISWSPMASGTTANLKAIAQTEEFNPVLEWWAVGGGGVIPRGTR